jgi:hypothetical protein
MQLLLYSTHLTLGYFMMLVIMAYQTQLFVLTIFGLSLGHFIFNVKAPVAEKPDPCCADIGDDEESDYASQATRGGGAKTMPVGPPATLEFNIEGMMCQNNCG